MDRQRSTSRRNGGNHDLSPFDDAASGAAFRVALREEDFGRVLSAGLALIIVGTLAYSIGGGWSIVDGLYVAVGTLTTSSILDPDLTITDPWLKLSRPATCSWASASSSRSPAVSAWDS
jgi:hypothetical protein